FINDELIVCRYISTNSKLKLLDRQRVCALLQGLQRKNSTSTKMRIIFIWLTVTMHSIASDKCEILHGKSREYYDYNWGRKRTTCDGVLSSEIKCNYTDTGNYPDTSQLCQNVSLRFYPDKITILPGSAFKTGFEVSKFYLEDLGITKVTPGAFNHQSSVQSIFLSKNNICQIGDGVFNSLMSLEVLDLSENEISYISEDAFSSVPLKQVNVSYNNVSSIPDSLRNVKVLDMSHNCIKSIPPRMFATNTLNISNNKIDKIDLSYFPNISTLYITNNEIESINIADTTLKVLDLRDNKLKTLPGDLKELKVFNVMRNQISKLPNKALIAKNLQEFILRGNNISDIPVQYFRELGKLEVLDLSKNSLSVFNFGTFDTLQSLITLNISYNKFKTLPVGTFHLMKGLRNLYFSHNSLTEVDVDDLLKYLPKLKMVEMQENAFNCHHLLEVCHTLQKHEVTFERGLFSGGNNVYGMNCSGDSDLINVKERLKSPEINELYPTLLNYFNNEFRNSNFVQYLENLENEESEAVGSILLSNLTEIFTNIKQLIHEVNNTSQAHQHSLNGMSFSQNQMLETLKEIHKGLKAIPHINQHLEDLEQRQTRTEEKLSFTQTATSKEYIPVLILLTIIVGVMLVFGYTILSRMGRIGRQKSDVELARLAESKPDSVNS
ncbi:unnamed protein product, partial [Callosobruchus maculatus]